MLSDVRPAAQGLEMDWRAGALSRRAAAPECRTQRSRTVGLRRWAIG